MRKDSSSINYKWEFVPRYGNDDSNVLDGVANPLTNGGNKPGESAKRIKYSNVAILHSQYIGMNKEELERKRADDIDVRIFNIYVEGAGTEEIWSGNKTEQLITAAGSISGKGHTGIINLVSKVVFMVQNILSGYSEERLEKADVHFDIFGFSRGATCARLFAQLVTREKESILPCENRFKNSYASSCFKKNKLVFLDKIKTRTVDFLGIFDTVSAVGGLTVDSYMDNTEDYGLFSPSNSNVNNVFHIIALDEYRSHFGVTDIGSICSANKVEIYIPGSHADIGGGYIDEINKFDLNLYLTPGLGQQRTKSDKVLLITNIFNNYDTEDLSISTLRDLGWIQDNNLDMRLAFDWRVKNAANRNGVHNYVDWVEEAAGTITVKRYVLGGYCNIPLKIMKDRAEKVFKSNRTLFLNPGESPIEYDPYFISKKDPKLNSTVEELLGLYDESGKVYYMPGRSYNSMEYRDLRNYLHFTSDESLGYTPSYNRNVICRYVYSGDVKPTVKRKYMSEVKF